MARGKAASGGKPSCWLAIIALTCFFTTGCGSIKARSQVSTTAFYCGVGYDMEKVASADEWMDLSIQGTAGGWPILLPHALLRIVDVPLSLATDTFLLPVDALRRSKFNASESAQESDDLITNTQSNPR
jgi:uncharacterized protein YceK